MTSCRFRGHRDKVFLEPEDVDATTEVQPRVQARGVKLARERGVSVSQAARDLDLHENVARAKWVREQQADPGSAFPGHGVTKPESQEIERLRRELARMKTERDILKKAAVGQPVIATASANVAPGV